MEESDYKSNQLLYNLEGLKEWLLHNKSRLRSGIVRPFSLIDQDFNILYCQIESFIAFEKYFQPSMLVFNDLKK